jgi:hypothetical protein
MLTAISLAATLLLSPAAVADSAAAVVAATSEDKAMTSRLKDEFLAWQHGKIDRTHYTSQVNAALTDSAVAQLGTQLASLGDVKSTTFVSKTQVSGYDVYVYDVECAKGTIRMTVSIDANDLIGGIFFKPA